MGPLPRSTPPAPRHPPCPTSPPLKTFPHLFRRAVPPAGGEGGPHFSAHQGQAVLHPADGGPEAAAGGGTEGEVRGAGAAVTPAVSGGSPRGSQARFSVSLVVVVPKRSQVQAGLVGWLHLSGVLPKRGFHQRRGLSWVGLVYGWLGGIGGGKVRLGRPKDARGVEVGVRNPTGCWRSSR